MEQLRDKFVMVTPSSATIAVPVIPGTQTISKPATTIERLAFTIENGNVILKYKTSDGDTMNEINLMALDSDHKRKFFIGGNWKSNGNSAFVKEFAESCLNQTKFNSSKGDVVITPPILYAPMLNEKLKDSMM